MFIKSERWLVNIQVLHDKRRKQCDKCDDDLKEAGGASMEGEDHAKSFNELKENMTLYKSEWK